VTLNSSALSNEIIPVVPEITVKKYISLTYVNTETVGLIG